MEATGVPCPRRDDPYDNESPGNPPWLRYWSKRLSESDNIRLRNKRGPPSWESVPNKFNLLKEYHDECTRLRLQDGLAWIQRMEKFDSETSLHISEDELINRATVIQRIIFDYNKSLEQQGIKATLLNAESTLNQKIALSDKWLQPLSALKIRKDMLKRLDACIPDIISEAQNLRKKIDFDAILCEDQKRFQNILASGQKPSKESAELKKIADSVSNHIVEYVQFLQNNDLTDADWLHSLKETSTFFKGHSALLSSKAVSALFWVDESSVNPSVSVSASKT